ncbi:MAG: hypothetical protein Kow00121_37240 [Elainellaceae cyanobacterium]
MFKISGLVVRTFFARTKGVDGATKIARAGIELAAYIPNDIADSFYIVVVGWRPKNG